MARVSDWFNEWAGTLIVRSGRLDWPDRASEDGAEFWRDVERSLVRCGATFAHADEASSMACDQVELWPNQFRGAIVELVKGLQKAEQDGLRAEQGGVKPDSMDEAKRLSRDCVDCGGGGITYRFVHPEHEGKLRTAGGGAMPVGASIPLHCGCPMGVLLARKDRDSPKDERVGMLDISRFPGFHLASVPWSDGWDNQYRYRPSRWNAVDRRPDDAPAWSDSISESRVHFRQLQADLAMGVRDRKPTADRPSATITLTPTQEQFLRDLEPGRRAAFEALSPGRKSQILTPFRDRIIDVDIRAAMAELPMPAPKPTVPEPSPEPETQSGPDHSNYDETPY